jgi:subtilisin-like proprotein convertase family protein
MVARPHTRKKNNRFDFAKLEHRNLLANDVLPDVFAWESEERGYLHDYVVEGDLLRFSTAFANQGAGHLEVFGGEPTANGNQEVFQRIYDDEGGFRDRLAGEFTYHEGHGHIHFDGYAIYNLREIGPAGEIGDIVATGGKISFCLIDITRYDDDAPSSNYGSCGTTQGVSAGWSDVYGRGLADQWINISGIDDGDYYLEVVTDPEDKLLESDETNNTTIITITIEDGPGNNGDRLEPNNSFTQAYNMGIVSQRVEPGLSIHTDQDVDYYQFAAVEQGEFQIQVDFSHDLGNIDAFVYDSNFDLVASGESVTDLEDLSFFADPNETYFLEILGVDGATNGFDLSMYGPGDVITTTVTSSDGALDIPDAPGSSTAGETLVSTLEGPDVTISDLNLIFGDLDHTWLADLSIALVSPSGTRAHIIRSDYEGTGDGPLDGSNNFTGTVLDDQAPTNIANGTAPYTGSFNVNWGDISNPLSAFNGESALGTWSVEITDWFSSDTGTLREWGIMFTGLDNNLGDSNEQNDSFPQATDLGTIGTYTQDDLSIHNATDLDFYRFNAQDSGHVQVDLTFLHDDGNLDFAVYDSNQQEIARSETINDDESMQVPVQAGELYFIEVLANNNDGNGYDLAIEVPQIAPTIEAFAINDGGVERSVVRELTVSFSEIVNVDSSSFLLENLDAGTSFAPDVTSQYVNGRTVATLTFSGSDIIGGSLADGNYRLTTLDTITDASGNRLDGNGDGSAGDDRTDDFFRLYGDVTGDGSVDVFDLLQLRQAYEPSGGTYNAALDYDGDGEVDIFDLLEFRKRFGSSIEG